MVFSEKHKLGLVPVYVTHEFLLKILTLPAVLGISFLTTDTHGNFSRLCGSKVVLAFDLLWLLLYILGECGFPGDWRFTCEIQVYLILPPHGSELHSFDGGWHGHPTALSELDVKVSSSRRLHYVINRINDNGGVLEISMVLVLNL